MLKMGQAALLEKRIWREVFFDYRICSTQSEKQMELTFRLLTIMAHKFLSRGGDSLILHTHIPEIDETFTQRPFTELVVPYAAQLDFISVTCHVPTDPGSLVSKPWTFNSLIELELNVLEGKNGGFDFDTDILDRVLSRVPNGLRDAPK